MRGGGLQADSGGIRETKEAIDKKIEQVSKIITEHLIDGNEIKLLENKYSVKDID